MTYHNPTRKAARYAVVIASSPAAPAASRR
jgi:hypothetical protein